MNLSLLLKDSAQVLPGSLKGTKLSCISSFEIPSRGAAASYEHREVSLPVKCGRGCFLILQKGGEVL